MPLAGVIAVRQARADPVVNVPPVIGTNVGGIGDHRFGLVDRQNTACTFGHPETRSSISAPGVTCGTVENGSLSTARRMSSRL